MSDKLRLLRKQAAAYLQDARSAEDDRAAARLLLLAAQCQERILELEGQMDPGGPRVSRWMQRIQEDDSTMPLAGRGCIN